MKQIVQGDLLMVLKMQQVFMDLMAHGGLDLLLKLISLIHFVEYSPR